MILLLTPAHWLPRNLRPLVIFMAALMCLCGGTSALLETGAEDGALHIEAPSEQLRKGKKQQVVSEADSSIYNQERFDNA